MAVRDLQQLLLEVELELEQNASAYRKLVSDKKAHSLYVTKKGLKDAIRKQIRFVAQEKLDSQRSTAKLGNTPQKLNNEINRLGEEYYNILFAEYQAATQRLAKQDFLTCEFEGSASEFTVIVEQEASKSSISIFSLLRDIKKKEEAILVGKLNDALAALDNELESEKFQKLKLDQNRFIDVGHVGSDAVSVQRRDAMDSILTKFQQRPSKALQSIVSSAKRKIIKRAQKKYTSGSTQRHVIHIEFEPAGFNRRNGSKYLQKHFGNLNKKLNKIVAKDSQKYLNQKGSESPLEIEELKLNTVLFETLVKDEKGRTRQAKGPARAGKKGPKPGQTRAQHTTKIKTQIGDFMDSEKVSAKLKFPRSERLQNNSINLLGLLNARLHQTVLANMGSPRLNNRTGRFVNSIRATNISRNTRGGIGVDYTYLLNPYQVFETTSGSPLASPERDPRNLIDASIREIARELVGKNMLTTRRV